MAKLLVLCGDNRYAKWCASSLAVRHPDVVAAYVVDGAENLNSDFSFVSQERQAAINEAKILPYRNEAQLVDIIRMEGVTTVVCLWWEHILKILPTLDINVINTHPSYLPFNRGKYPYYWSISEGTPFGVTIHRVDAGVDTGGILWRRRRDPQPTDTGETLYRYGCYEMTFLFLDHLDEIANEWFPPVILQDEQWATAHSKKDFYSAPWNDDTYIQGRAIDFLDELRARTFNNSWSGQEIVLDGKRYHIHVNLVEHKDEGSQSS